MIIAVLLEKLGWDHKTDECDAGDKDQFHEALKEAEVLTAQAQGRPPRSWEGLFLGGERERSTNRGEAP